MCLEASNYQHPRTGWPKGPLWWSSSLPWELGRSASRPLWLELVLPGGLLKSHSHSAMRFRTASSSASMTKHFLAEGSVHVALEWRSLQGKANSVLSFKPASRSRPHGPCEGRRVLCQWGGGGALQKMALGASTTEVSAGLPQDDG